MDIFIIIIIAVIVILITTILYITIVPPIINQFIKNQITFLDTNPDITKLGTIINKDLEKEPLLNEIVQNIVNNIKNNEYSKMDEELHEHNKGVLYKISGIVILLVIVILVLKSKFKIELVYFIFFIVLIEYFMIILFFLNDSNLLNVDNITGFLLKKLYSYTIS